MGQQGTGLEFDDLELCTQQLYFSLQAHTLSFFLLFFFSLHSMLLFQMEKMGLVHRNSRNIYLSAVLTFL